ncbi:MAG: hypothetical protein HYZ57_10455 [Acidobacteria bacterium]|nr:hypothetical protein [Acidobacteriota bacterium]
MRPLACVLFAGLAFAQGTTPRPKAEDYPARGAITGATVGVEYNVRTFAAEGRTFVIGDYLVVGVAVYPHSRKQEVPIAHSRFTLRINGRKDAIFPQPPGMVAASLKYPDWERERGVTVAAGPVIIGRPQIQPRFPGDQRPPQTRMPAPPRAPSDAGAPAAEPVDFDELIARAALPEGRVTMPVSGFLYFAWRGKLSKIKSVDLVIEDEPQPIVLRLR